MKYFGIRHQPHKNWKYYLGLLHIPFVILTITAFVIFALYHNITSIVFSKDKVDVFKEDLQQIALYFWMIDKDFSQFLLTLDDIVTAYGAGENILTEKTSEIEQTWEYIYQNKSYLAGLGFENYSDVMEFLADSWKYKDELFALLGKDHPQNYLVILQNSNERRPNGGFFGSFAFIQVYQARIQYLEIVDSYFPDFIGRNVGIAAPAWSKPFLPEGRVAFIAANWFGFTPIDGANIKRLYEDIFGGNYNPAKVDEVINADTFSMLANKDIKGVLFIESKLLETIMPSIRHRLWERQFVNAAIDIIRGESLRNKKEIYIQEVNQFFRANAFTITQHIVNNFSDVIEQRSINVFLSNVSDQFHGLIQKRSLSNVYDENYIYTWDINDSYNKIDGFIDKQIEIIDADGQTILETDSDIIPIADLTNGSYTLYITYQLYVPNFYKDMIASFEKKYDIELTNRERIILGLMPNVGITPEGPLRYRTRSVVYFPLYVTIPGGQDIGFRSEFFTAPFARGWYYNMRIRDGEMRKTISIDFIIDR